MDLLPLLVNAPVDDVCTERHEEWTVFHDLAQWFPDPVPQPYALVCRFAVWLPAGEGRVMNTVYAKVMEWYH